MAIVLGGGGSDESERDVFAAFAGLWDRERPVLYLPLALARRDGYPDRAIAWARAALGEAGVSDLEAWPSLDGRAPSDLEAFSAIFIGGGNTRRAPGQSSGGCHCGARAPG